MAYPKIDTNGRDVVVLTNIYMPDGSRETYRHRIHNATGKVRKSRLTGVFVANTVRMGLELVFGKRGVREE